MIKTMNLHFALSAVCILLDETVRAFGSEIGTADGWSDTVLVKQIEVGSETAAFVMRIAFDWDTDKRGHFGQFVIEQ